MEYLVILHGEVYRDEAFVVPPNCKLKFTASANTTNIVGSNISYYDIFSIPNSDEYITGNICEDILLNGPTSQDWVYPGLCGVIPKNLVNKTELTYYANGQEQLIPAFQKSILKFDYWYNDDFKPKKRKLSDVITELIKLNPSIVLHLLNCRNINAPSYFGDCLGYLPVTIKGNTFLTSNKCTINGVTKLGNLQGDTIGGEGEESLIMIYELTPTQKNEIIKDIYDEENAIKNFALMFRIGEKRKIYIYCDSDDVCGLTKYVSRFNNASEVKYIFYNEEFQTIIQPLISSLLEADSLDKLLTQLSENVEMVLLFHPKPGENCETYKCTIEEFRKRVVSSNLGLTNIEEELKKSVIQLKSINVYKLEIPHALKQKLLKNEIWKTLIEKLSIEDTAEPYPSTRSVDPSTPNAVRAQTSFASVDPFGAKRQIPFVPNKSSIIKLTGLQPCLIILLNIFINNRKEYEENVNPRIKDLDDTNDLKPTLEILAQSSKVKFGGFVSKPRRRYARSRKKPKTTAARIAVKHHKDPKE